jgi:hypothetical protein
VPVENPAFAGALSVTELMILNKRTGISWLWKA